MTNASSRPAAQQRGRLFKIKEVVADIRRKTYGADLSRITHELIRNHSSDWFIRKIVPSCRETCDLVYNENEVYDYLDIPEMRKKFAFTNQHFYPVVHSQTKEQVPQMVHIRSTDKKNHLEDQSWRDAIKAQQAQYALKSNGKLEIKDSDVENQLPAATRELLTAVSFFACKDLKPGSMNWKYGHNGPEALPEHLRIDLSGLVCLIRLMGMLYHLKGRYGIDIPEVLHATVLTFFGWHCEDYLLGFYNTLHCGVVKSWFATSPEHAPRLNEIIKKYHVRAGLDVCVDPATGSIHKNVITPLVDEILDEGIDLWWAEQEPGDTITASPGVPHFGGNMGANVATAGNIADPYLWRTKVGETDLHKQCPTDKAQRDSGKGPYGFNEEDAKMMKPVCRAVREAIDNLPETERWNITWDQLPDKLIGRNFLSEELARTVVFAPQYLESKFVGHVLVPAARIVPAKYCGVRQILPHQVKTILAGLRNVKANRVSAGFVLVGNVDAEGLSVEEIRRQLENGEVTVEVVDGIQRLEAGKQFGHLLFLVAAYANCKQFDVDLILQHEAQKENHVIQKRDGHHMLMVFRRRLKAVLQRRLEDDGIPVDAVPEPDQGFDEPRDIPCCNKSSYTPLPLDPDELFGDNTARTSELNLEVKRSCVEVFPWLSDILIPSKQLHSSLKDKENLRQAYKKCEDVAKFPECFSEKIREFYQRVSRRDIKVTEGSGNVAREFNVIVSPVSFSRLLPPKDSNYTRKQRWAQFGYALDLMLRKSDPWSLGKAANFQLVRTAMLSDPEAKDRIPLVYQSSKSSQKKRKADSVNDISSSTSETSFKRTANKASEPAGFENSAHSSIRASTPNNDTSDDKGTKRKPDDDDFGADLSAISDNVHAGVERRSKSSTPIENPGNHNLPARNADDHSLEIPEPTRPLNTFFPNAVSGEADESESRVALSRDVEAAEVAVTAEISSLSPYGSPAPLKIIAGDVSIAPEKEIANQLGPLDSVPIDVPNRIDNHLMHCDMSDAAGNSEIGDLLNGTPRQLDDIPQASSLARSSNPDLLADDGRVSDAESSFADMDVDYDSVSAENISGIMTPPPLGKDNDSDHGAVSPRPGSGEDVMSASDNADTEHVSATVEAVMDKYDSSSTSAAQSTLGAHENSKNAPVSQQFTMEAGESTQMDPAKSGNASITRITSNGEMNEISGTNSPPSTDSPRNDMAAAVEWANENKETSGFSASQSPSDLPKSSEERSKIPNVSSDVGRNVLDAVIPAQNPEERLTENKDIVIIDDRPTTLGDEQPGTPRAGDPRSPPSKSGIDEEGKPDFNGSTSLALNIELYRRISPFLPREASIPSGPNPSVDDLIQAFNSMMGVLAASNNNFNVLLESAGFFPGFILCIYLSESALFLIGLENLQPEARKKNLVEGVYFGDFDLQRLKYRSKRTKRWIYLNQALLIPSHYYRALDDMAVSFAFGCLAMGNLIQLVQQKFGNAVIYNAISPPEPLLFTTDERGFPDVEIIERALDCLFLASQAMEYSEFYAAALSEVLQARFGDLSRKFLAVFAASTTEEILSQDVAMGFSPMKISKLVQELKIPFLSEFSLFNVRGDGNCFFRAISMSLFGSEKDHLLIRLAVACGLLQHGDVLDAYHKRHNDPLRWLKDYLEKACCSRYDPGSSAVNVRFWGGTSLCLILSHVLKRNIITHNTFPQLFDLGLTELPEVLPPNIREFPVYRGSEMYEFRDENAIKQSKAAVRPLHILFTEVHFICALPNETNAREYRPASTMQLQPIPRPPRQKKQSVASV
ncbi:uncharacterized protein LOC129582415 [Paramacrobiotus metropolitanus]|uniref:uncharacterized protein LOC129582415 n=1 Tax=Paramacrobiotus metropolitanus TaxID=2943436 RepID=UPI002446424D|nr:uncharacterized protein LOC129582415 [Paramacrobiotus metropolitanus]